MSAPLGNQNAAKAKQWSAAIERALERMGDPSVDPDQPVERTPKMKALDTLADQFVAKIAADQDLGFYKEFADRLDGKPAQAIIGDPENPLQTVQRIELVPLTR
jgi:hypothetical protein